MDSILSIKGLYKAFDNFKLDNISFELEKGCIMGFIGQNGAGKTSTLKMIMNAIQMDSGEIKVFGKELIQNEVQIKSKIGFIPDDDYFLSLSSLKQHAKTFKLFFETWSDELFQKYIDLWQLPVDKKIMELSKGTKTKAMLALTLAHQPDLLILDEPTAGLDPVARIELLDLLRDYVSDGEKAVLFSTHITSDLDKVADYITIINNGKIIESLSIDKIEEKYVIISGDMDELKGNEAKFIGIRRGSSSFEGLIQREKAATAFPALNRHTPNIENMLTFSIWGNRQ